MIIVTGLKEIITKFHNIELLLLYYWTQLGIPSDIKRRVIPNNKTMGKPLAINNSINNRKAYISNLDQLLKISAMGSK